MEVLGRIASAREQSPSIRMCHSGNWGMDDSRKRVPREHLEPSFRLHREANLNIIRNLVGQNTEQTFYDLADEYA
jgi:hypothetical protein